MYFNTIFFRVESVVDHMKWTSYEGHNHGADIRLDQYSSSSDEDQGGDQKLESERKVRRRTNTLDIQLRQGMLEMRDQLHRVESRNSNTLRYLGRRMSKIEDLVRQLKKKSE